VSSTSLTPDEFRAAAETHRELGPEYQSAVIDSFIDKVGREIDARVDARLAQARVPGAVFPGPQGQLPVVTPQVKDGRGGQLALAIVSMALGVPLTAIAMGTHAGTLALFIIWMGIVAVNVAFALINRPPSR
jgi:hypothetical protein